MYLYLCLGLYFSSYAIDMNAFNSKKYNHIYSVLHFSFKYTNSILQYLHFVVNNVNKKILLFLHIFFCTGKTSIKIHYLSEAFYYVNYLY